MGKRKVTLCDHTFLEHSKSASIGGGNIGVGPRHFEWEYADAKTARFVTDGDIKHAKGRGQVAWLLEPLGLHPENYYVALERSDEFDAILTHTFLNLEGVKCPEKVKWYGFGGSWIPFEQWGTQYSKGRCVSILLSDKNTLPGHKLRHQVAERFGNRIDVLQGIQNKIDALAPYSYSIIIESEKIGGYFTEKLIDCLCVGTIPIYWGDPEIGRIFDKSGIVEVNTLEDIEVAITTASPPHILDVRTNIVLNIGLCHKWAVCENGIFWSYPELFS